uniref:Peptidase S54 rhomboid domain-containing protein n=1 Tax=Hemiselmis andersenii TaxID=464988 RepID=A0A6U5CWQ2_HEMAN|mmetsp:Transcript_23226/g.53934  ORF Transcript_23226/g.53934 Transcript_23226/m.53934 type:complete len:269 (-) Transcript_23226:135-941(-)
MVDSDLPLIAQPVNYPASSCVIGICCLVCYYLNSRGLGYEDVGSSYWLVVIEGQWWRTITASVSHLSVVHLMFNCYSTWQLREAERHLGVITYLLVTLRLLGLSILMQLSLHAALRHTRSGDRSQRAIGIGYSGIVFGWMTWASLHQQGAHLNLFFFRVPFSISPFVSLIVTQVMIPNVDFWGHLAGIAAGYIEGWGLVAWLTGFWLLQAVIWAGIAVLVSLVRSGVTVPGVEEIGLSESDRACAAAAYSSQADPWLTPRSRREIPNV